MSGSQQLLLGGIPTVTPVDPYFYSVTSLLHGDGTNGGQNNTFLDSSTNNFSITRNGNTTQGSFSPFSQTGWSNYFDGNGDYLSIADNVALDLGTGDFTIEGWAYFSAAGSDGDGLISKRDDPAFTNGAWRVAWDATNRKINIACADEGTTRSTPAVSLHSWVHFAFVRSGSTLNCYANGVLGDQDASWGHNLNNAYTLLIGTNVVGSNFLTGYLSNIRILKGTAVYSGATYTVPTTPLTAITNTSLLTCQSNRFLDASTNNFTITANGDVSVQPFSPFNPTTAYSTSSIGGSGYFDGSGDYLNVGSGTNNIALSGDFCIEAWIYRSSNADGTIIGNYNSSPNRGWSFRTYSSTNLYLYFQIDGGAETIYQTSAGSAPINQWMHLVWCRSGTNTSVFINGVRADNRTLSGTSTGNGGLSVSALSQSRGDINFNGYISSARVVTGSSVYDPSQTTITVPTSPLIAVSGTQALLSFTNGAIFDNAAVADYETVGNAQISTSVKKYGTGSLAFDGTGDYLVSPGTQSLTFGTGDFTIEFWLYLNVLNTDQIIFDMRPASTQGVYPALYFADSGDSLNYYVDGNIRITSGAITSGVWYHVAICRTASQTKMFINGTQVGSTYADTTNYLCNRLVVGAQSFTLGNGPLNGYIDDMRISKGIARYTYNFTPPTAEFPNIGGTVTLTADPYFDYTTLLLPGNGTNGAQNNTFLDSSTNNFTITRNGNTTQGTFSPFSQTGWGNYFDGSGDYLETPSNAAFTLGSSGDFTVECWVYATATPGNYAAFMTTWADANTGYPNRWFIGVHDSKIKWYNDAGASAIAASSNIQLNTWLHVAAVRSGSTITLYINGTAIGTQTTSQSYTTQGTVKLGYSGTGGNYFYGYISNARVVKGTAVYTANFTPPTAPLTAITNTSLLTCQSNRFIDNSTNAFAITANGDVSVQAFSPFNPTASWSAATYGGSGYFDGSGDYLTTASSANLAIGTSDFCIEYWVYSLNTNEITPFGQWATGNADWILQYRTGPNQFRFYYNSSNELSGNYTMVPNQWTHVAVCRSGSTMSLYVNGTRLATKTDSTSINNGRGLTIGVNPDGPIQQTTGYITDARLVVGSSVYTPSSSTLTVPTAPLTAITNTKFLTNFTNAGIYDATSKNDLETVGNAQISTTQSKFGGSSMYFDGTGDSLDIVRSSNFVSNWDADFTIECWVYANNLSAQHIIFANVGTNSSGYNSAYINTNGSIGIGKAGVNEIASAASTFTSGQWNHLAFVRYGSNLNIYYNGVSVASTTSASTYLNSTIVGMAIGKNYQTTPAYMNGYIDDFRITKGIARYTSNFIPPTTAFLTL